jgi:drug/metabolite transporter (DMT)-like permease
VTPLAFALVLSSAVLHATWNLFAKRMGGGTAFVWLFGVLATLVYTPLALWSTFTQLESWTAFSAFTLIVSALFRMGYLVLLQQGYRLVDMSLVYPLARGTGPLLATVGGVVLFLERPTPLAIAGTCLIVFGVFYLAGGLALFFKKLTPNGGAVSFGLLAGLCIAGYTLWDTYALREANIPPVLLFWGSSLVWSFLLLPTTLRNWHEVRLHWRNHQRELWLVAVLSPLSYILALMALSFSPVSYVAPVRETSIFVGAALGGIFLKERIGWQRIFGCATITLGVIALAVG